MASNLRRLGRLAPSSSVLFVCDIQEVFRKATFQMPTLIHGTTTLVAAAKEFNIPIVETTQNAPRLGDTVSEIKDSLRDHPNAATFDKTLFSMLTPEVELHMQALPHPPKSVILCGIEGHVCVLQTCLDLLDKGYDVHVVSDAVSSSTAYNRAMSLEVGIPDLVEESHD
jgi:nicotinamidase-related amidase